jgi:hypothetical protein
MPETGRNRKVLGGGQGSGFQFQVWVNIEACRILEKLAQAAQQATFALVVKGFVEDFR